MKVNIWFLGYLCTGGERSIPEDTRLTVGPYGESDGEQDGSRDRDAKGKTFD